MKACPNCSARLDDGAARCSECGRQLLRLAESNGFHKQCADVRDGQRCARRGTLSQNLLGDAPYWCADHFPPWGPNFGRSRLTADPIAPTSADLTDQQWYNVCRFFPTTAARAQRERFVVGAHDRLHATAKLGPLLRTFRMREPGEDDE